MYNTPATFAVYVAGLIFKWLKAKGGVAGIEQVNIAKADRLYQLIDGSGGFYSNPVALDCRSRMNIPFCLHDEALDGEPLLQLAWDEQGPIFDAASPSPPERLRAALAALPAAALVPREAKVAVSERLQDLILTLVRSA